MRVVCHYFKVSRNHNFLLLVKLKNAPVVVDGDAWRKCDLLPSVGGWLVRSIPQDLPLESARCVL